MAFTLCDNYRVEYEIEGAGQPLFLLHGTSQTARETWVSVLRKLGGTRAAVLVNYSGSGLTEDAGGDLSMPDLAGQVLSVADAAGFDEFDVAGHSLGACVTLQLAADYPKRVSKIALLAGFVSAEDPRMQFQFAWWQRLALENPRELAALLMYSCFSQQFLSRLSREKIDAAVEAVYKNGNWPGTARQVELDRRLDMREAISRIKQKALVVNCLHDFVVPPQQAAALTSLLAAATCAELESGHAGAAEQAGRLCAILNDFFG